MKKICAALLLIAGLLSLFGCGEEPEAQTVPEDTGDPAVTTVEATVPADGNPADVTCKGSYTGQGNGTAVVARIGDAELTNGVLSAYYWAEAAAYRESGKTPAPDFDAPLDTQSCPIDSSVNSWQQYFLKRALTSWHSSQALVLQGQDEGLPKEDAYNPAVLNRDEYLDGIPATRVLYGYSDSFQPNSMHQAYLDEIPDMLDDLVKEKGFADAAELAEKGFGTSAADLERFVETYNRGYMYYTSLSYDITPETEAVEAYFDQNEEAFREKGITRDSGFYVDIRQILLQPTGQVAVEGQPQVIGVEPEMTQEPVTLEADGTVTCSEKAWTQCQADAEALLNTWRTKTKATDATFADLANKNSKDSASALNGGAYRRIRQGQLMESLDSWCFDPARQAGDTTVIRTEYGCHILYFTGRTEIWYAQAEDGLRSQLERQLLETAMEKYPAQIDYSAIVLPEAQAVAGAGDVLYPDVAHERFPEVPLYLQQEYQGTMFGGFKLATNGCGITSFSMVASYLSDEEWTPPEMCARYGNYSFSNGTDGTIFINEPPVLGFYLLEKTYEPTDAHQALEEGHLVVSLQHKGYWTRGGHYIVLEKLNEDGTVQVRDSNIYNYGSRGRIPAHFQDKHTWASITNSGSAFWIFAYKVKRIPACSRCGSPEGMTKGLLQEPYICEKCRPAILRRETYLNGCAG